MINYYPEFSHYTQTAIKKGHEIELHSLNRADLIIYASQWAANSAINFYGINPAKVKVVPFGANIQKAPDNKLIIEAIEKKSVEQLDLLFIGIDWERKGGEKILALVKLLNDTGQKTMLHIVGPVKNPVSNEQLPFLKFHGFLDKSVEADRIKMEELFHKCHFLVMLSKAECYGLVYCEANAYGMPVIGEATGGVPTIIQHEQNGLLFPVDTDIKIYAEKIRELFADKIRFRKMCHWALEHFQIRLNWDVAGREVKNCIKALDA